MCILSFGLYPSIRILYADIFKHSVSSIFICGEREFHAYMTYEDRTQRVFQNVGTQNSAASESPKRKNTTKHILAYTIDGMSPL